MTLNRLNLIGSTGVLKSTNDLLDFLNEHKDKEYRHPAASQYPQHARYRSAP